MSGVTGLKHACATCGDLEAPYEGCSRPGCVNKALYERDNDTWGDDPGTVAAMEREIAELRAALKPFADCADWLDLGAREISDDTGLWLPSTSDPNVKPPGIYVATVRNARAALTRDGGEE